MSGLFSYKQSAVAKFLVVIYFSIIGARYATGITELYFILPVIGIGILFFMKDRLLENKTLFYSLVLWAFIFFIFSVFSSLRSNFYSVFYVLIGLAAFSVGFVLFCFRCFSFYLSFFVIILFYSYVAISLLSSDKAHLITLNEVFPGVSRNIIGAMAVYFQIFYAASFYRMKKRLPFISMCITFYILLAAYGRSSIIAGVLILLVYVFYYLRKNLLTVSLVMISLVVFYIIIGFDIDFQNNSFSQGIESARVNIYHEYIETTDFFGLLLGHSIFDSVTASFFDGNAHSSYIRGHSYYGVALFFLFCFLLFAVVVRFNYSGLLYISFIFIYMFRAIFESIAFFDVFDFLFFYLLVIFIYKDNDSAFVVQKFNSNFEAKGAL